LFFKQGLGRGGGLSPVVRLFDVIGGDVNARIRDTKATRVVMLIAHDGFAVEAGKAKDRTSLLKVVRKPTLS